MYFRGVYFVECQETKLIKIGYSANPLERLKTLQAYSPTKLELIAFIEGPRHFENQIHKALFNARRHSEWFEPTREVLRYTAEYALPEDTDLDDLFRSEEE